MPAHTIATWVAWLLAGLFIGTNLGVLLMCIMHKASPDALPPDTNEKDTHHVR